MNGYLHRGIRIMKIQTRFKKARDKKLKKMEEDTPIKYQVKEMKDNETIDDNIWFTYSEIKRIIGKLK